MGQRRLARIWRTSAYPPIAGASVERLKVGHVQRGKGHPCGIWYDHPRRDAIAILWPRGGGGHRFEDAECALSPRRRASGCASPCGLSAPGRRWPPERQHDPRHRLYGCHARRVCIKLTSLVAGVDGSVKLFRSAFGSNLSGGQRNNKDHPFGLIYRRSLAEPCIGSDNRPGLVRARPQWARGGSAGTRYLSQFRLVEKTSPSFACHPAERT